MGTAAPGIQLQLPPISFATKHSTGVKGVINDARHYETTRRNKWTNVIRNSILSLHGVHIDSYIGSRRLNGNNAEANVFSSSSNITDESFLQWCDSRRRSLESEANTQTYWSTSSKNATY
ncbi:hypothetical protein S40285_09721 [Stachybotrys chlorohalonatus IBT 40285]|uniref:Uncharacterized protein n=1 Tax=Stachybotrys chlorohalonatus (strain IBT 40285) TaxID=1283841 RepID=A0A084QKQ8_STAC4|nr:hypothetical protein S40285_09721 [Stachybotrys chlorohalonata IBT 40285]